MQRADALERLMDWFTAALITATDPNGGGDEEADERAFVALGRSILHTKAERCIRCRSTKDGGKEEILPANDIRKRTYRRRRQKCQYAFASLCVAQVEIRTLSKGVIYDYGQDATWQSENHEV